MKQYILALLFLSSLTYSEAQDISMSDVPSVVLNNFQAEYPKAKDIEWELSNSQYEVEFELGWNRDFKIWYDKAGHVMKRKEEVSRKELPAVVLSSLHSEFKSYRVDGAEKITTEKGIQYEVEMSALLKRDWKVFIHENGEILKKYLED